MADINKFSPFIFKWEGGFVNDPDDSGGATNMGVTLSTWQQVGYDKNGDGKIEVADLKLLTKDDVVNRVLKPHYWDRWKADEINTQSIANILVDWVWGSGKEGVEIPQQILQVTADGIVGSKTIAAINTYPDQHELFDKITAARIDFINQIVVEHPKDEKFKQGWLNRINDIQWEK